MPQSFIETHGNRRVDYIPVRSISSACITASRSAARLLATTPTRRREMPVSSCGEHASHA